MTTIWTVVADGSRARVFQSNGRSRDFEEIQDLLNPLGRARDSQLRTDAQGRFAGKGEPSHSMSPRTDPAAKEHELFARWLGRFLDEARMARRFDKLRLAAAPRFLGRLRVHLGKQVRGMVMEEIPGGLCKLAAPEVRSRLARR
ncbi:hypothetical protein BKK79_03505 [Cupriavidus sp. USMAA2-4]|uniref:Host attachment protein n=1 Tax=Cupriavidus malaysiensis TaxID=367825 RepID=A0ABM6F495_9BURK|nr:MULTISPECIES: host attachment protein [Cupriavidus]AOY90982.1 hypothetical protein BKK79_03505 [Cupriavidus sp. USMAA2-4]AOY99445.1 hypothetical protein BKK81_09330 [Cupriavidus sp. USMAHM13]AOZ06062.1 hypothetical protein BKK80_09615 [Cupriavidus malaysiensis]